MAPYGTILDPEFTRLGGFLTSLLKTRPLVRTALHHAMSGDVLARVDNGELDVGFYPDAPQQAVGSLVTGDAQGFDAL